MEINPIKKEILSENISFSQACLGQFQDEVLSNKKQSKHWGFNAGSHLLYLTAMLGIVFLFHDLLLYWNPKSEFFVKPNMINVLSWIILIIIGLTAGIMFDRHADFKEAIQIVNNKEQYKNILFNAIEVWPEEPSKPETSFKKAIVYTFIIFAVICVFFITIGRLFI